MAEQRRKGFIPKPLKGFIAGGLSAAFAASLVHPLDTIKVRMQLAGEGAATAATTAASPTLAGGRLATFAAGSHAVPHFSGRVHFPAGPAAAAAAIPLPAKPGALDITANLIRQEGVAGLFSGVSATALRQILYSSSRMGIYEIIKTSLEDRQRHSMEARGELVDGPVAIPVQKKIGAALFAGAVGAAIGNPADLAMVRMQADGRLPVELRRNYRGVGDALSRIVREEGVVSLWRGCGPTVYRAMAVTAGQLAAYDQAKEFLIDRHIVPDGLPAHVTAAFTAAIVASVASNPFDVIKTRLMNMKKDPVTGAAPYGGALDCAVKTMKAEGPLALYKGLLPTIARQGPFALILFVTLEQVRKLMHDL